LGLHLSNKLAELLNGRITFRSEYGKGSEFTIVLAEQ
jgi:protein-histidine pros-kinase